MTRYITGLLAAAALAFPAKASAVATNAAGDTMPDIRVAAGGSLLFSPAGARALAILSQGAFTQGASILGDSIYTLPPDLATLPVHLSSLQLD